MKRTIDVSVRRSPKYFAFILIGAVLGATGGLILASLPVDTSSMTRQFTAASTYWTLMIFLAVVGGFLGAAVALVIDWIGRRRARVYAVEAEYTPTPASHPVEPAAAEAGQDDADGAGDAPASADDMRE